jgi:hypothetical protein
MPFAGEVLVAGDEQVDLGRGLELPRRHFLTGVPNMRSGMVRRGARCNIDVGSCDLGR